MNFRNFKLNMTRTITFLALIFLMFSVPGKVAGNSDSVRFSEKANLALRRTVHLLLAANGDSTSGITPVEQLHANTFTVRVDKLFNYDKLPSILQQSLQIHGIGRGYDVSVIRCESNVVVLGYNFQDLNQKGGVPCRGRKMAAGCYVLKVTFYPETTTASGNSSWWVLPIGSLLAGLGFIFWKRSNKQSKSGSDTDVDMRVDNINFGNSSLDVTNLTLTSGGKVCNLTYREAKLLHLLTDHKNEVLDRDFILKSVWGDEGVVVGRSVDVFVSRLRKLLAKDSTLKINAVHGIGYRLEVGNREGSIG